MRKYQPLEENPDWFNPIAYQRLRAYNDPNGNPRRLWAVYDEQGNIGALINEGYSGHPKHLVEYEIPMLPTIDIDVAQYNELKREAKSIGVYYEEM